MQKLALILTFLFGLQAAHANCYMRLHEKMFARSMEKLRVRSSYEVDQSTFADLAFVPTLMKAMNERIKNPYAQEIFEHQLRNPALNPELIVQRQKAVAYLSENPELMEQIDELLAKLTTHFESLHAHEPASAADVTLKTWLKHAGISDLMKGMFTLPAAFEPRFLSMVPMGIVFGNPKSATIQQHNNVLYAAQNILAKGKQIAGLVKPDDLPAELAGLFRLLNREDPKMKKGLRYFGWAGLTRFKSYVDWLLPINSLSYPQVKKLKSSTLEAAAYFEALADLEIMLRFAQLKRSAPDTFIFPTIDTNPAAPTRLIIKDGHFPSFKVEDSNSVANSIHIDSTTDQLVLMTGPNSGGKSTALRTVAHLTILAQMGMPVPAKSMELTPLRLITNMQTEDNIADGVSLFRSEIRRGKDVLDAVNSDDRYLLLLDEIFKGTDHEQHQAAELTMIRHILASDKIAFFSTHDRQLKQYLGGTEGIRYVHVDDDGSFMIKDGQSSTRNAADIMNQEGLPASYINDFMRAFDEVAPDQQVRDELLRPSINPQ